MVPITKVEAAAVQPVAPAVPVAAAKPAEAQSSTSALAAKAEEKAATKDRAAAAEAAVDAASAAGQRHEGAEAAKDRAAAADAAADEAMRSLDRLVACMVGQFSSAAQAARDPEFREISLKVAPIWAGRGEGKWLYVEQALASDLANPYRQRVYHVTMEPGTLQPAWKDSVLKSEVFSLPGDPKTYVGAWHDTSKLAGVNPAELSTRQGCSVYLKVEGDRFVGGTREHDCQSDLRGAKYATSEASIGPDGMVTWDRGYDAAGKQVWGATKGGYEFKKITASLTPPASSAAPAAATVPEK
jgi:hypothetical protein